jgi:putative transposase
MPPKLPLTNRKSIRLKGYDYSKPGYYFITTVVNDRECVLGEVIDNKMKLSYLGEITQKAWLDLPLYYSACRLDAACVMPNHFHGIIELITGNRVPLYHIVRSFKKYSSKRINKYLGSTGVPFWQRNYYEHIVRGEEELYRIRQYIMNNPAAWEADS